MIEFHNTGIGRKFFEGTLPQLTRTLERIAGAMERQLEIHDEFHKAVNEAAEEDPLLQKDNQYEAEYMEIDSFVGEHFPEDYQQAEWADMQLCDFVKGLLQELKERRMDAEKPAKPQ